MTNSPNHKNAIDPTVPTQSLRGKLMFAASAGILALVAPSGFYGMRSEAQTNMLPDGCIDDPATDSDIRYDTTQSDQFSEHKGWAGITFKF